MNRFSIALTAIISILFVVVFMARSAHAMDWGRTDCPQRSEVAGLLIAAGESRLALAMKPGGIIMELWARPDLSRWTEIWTWPRGQTCVVQFGREMMIFPPIEGDPA